MSHFYSLRIFKQINRLFTVFMSLNILLAHGDKLPRGMQTFERELVAVTFRLHYIIIYKS